MGFVPRTKNWFNLQKSINRTHHINGLKDRNHKIISGKVFDKNQYPSMNLKKKTLNKLRIEQNILNMLEGIYEKPHILDGKKIKSFLLKLGMR